MFSFHIRFGVALFWFQVDPHTPRKWDHTFEGNNSSNETVDIWEPKKMINYTFLCGFIFTPKFYGITIVLDNFPSF